MTADVLAEAVAAIDVVPPASFRWLGAPSPLVHSSVRRRLSESELRDLLVARLQHRLYDSFYCHGRPLPLTDNRPPPRAMGSPEFAAHLSTANCGSGSWEPGWTLGQARGEYYEVERDGLRLLAARGEWRTISGATVAIRLPKEMLRLSPGYYMAIFNEPLPASAPVVRLYWNLNSSSAATFVREATARAKAEAVPGRIKILNDPLSFGRADAAVMYVPGAALEAICELTRSVYRCVATNLRPVTPAFTRQLTPGVAIAEDPGGGQSFGEHRCHLIAEGVVLAHEQGCRALADRLAVVSGVLESQGLSADALYRRDLALDRWNPLS